VKRILFCLLSTGLMLGVALPALAGSINTTDQITLGASPAGSFVFTGNSSGTSFSLTLKNVVGLAAGSGIFSGVLNDWYGIGQNRATITSAGSGCGGTCIMLNQSGSLTFDLGSKKGEDNLLQGTLELVDISQSGTGASTNNEAIVDLTITGGTLASKFSGSDGVVQLTLLLGRGSLAGLKGILDAQIHSGSVNPLLSEPASLWMLGLGLLCVAGVIKLNIMGAASKSA
jgi:hypothetical protein